MEYFEDGVLEEDVDTPDTGADKIKSTIKVEHKQEKKVSARRLLPSGSATSPGPAYRNSWV